MGAVTEAKIWEKFEKAIDMSQLDPRSVQVFEQDSGKLDFYLAMIEREKSVAEKLLESTTTANVDKVVTIFLPALKKLARDSFIDKLIGVQPIDDRVGIVEIIDVEYDSSDANAKPSIGAGASVFDNITEEYSRDPGELQAVTRGLKYILREKEVRARSRKILSEWSWEVEDSTRRKANIENELTKAMSGKVVEEVNFELLYDLYNLAPIKSGWIAPLPTDAPPVKERKEQELYYTIEDVASEMYNETLRYPTWVVMNPRVASYLKRSNHFQGFVSNGGQMPSSMQRIWRAGTINDEFLVVVIPGLNTNDILMGYKGDNEVETGAIYCPYKPLVILNAQFDVNDWSWVKSVGSFYAKAMDIRTNLYARVPVTLP